MDTINISDALLQFKQHLDNNPRTILSAKFGDGKTYFLNEFIEQNNCHNDGDTYFVTLHPINYSVAQNEDVFEYVKRDILVQLNNDEQLPDIDLDSFFKIFCNWNDIKSLITFVLDFMPHGTLCKRILDYAEGKYKSYKSKCNTFSKYESVFKSQKGGLYENDAYTELIRITLTAIKTSKFEKTIKTCLIVEDLDRIDPAHLFRILNVIGAHIDINDDNKFGFDKIVLVMDYDVTGHIFHHFYGEQANYEGYMAKFFSRNPFKYSIKQIAIERLKDLLKKKYSISDKLLQIEYCGNALVNTLLSRFNELSVRDIERTIDKIETCLIQKVFVNKKERKINTITPLSIYLSVLVLTNTKWDSGTLFRNLQGLGDEFTKSLGLFLHEYINGNALYCNPLNKSQSLRISFVFPSVANNNIVIEQCYGSPNAINLDKIWQSAFEDTIKNINGQVFK